MDAYVLSAAKKSDLDRTDLAKDKSGVFTGSYCINPVNGEKIPVWVADYVLISYGTGAIMAVPAHDERDFEFAEKFGIEIRQVIALPDGDEEKGKLPYSGPGIMVNSGEYDGMQADTCKSKIITELEAKDVGKGAVNYKLRDWIFSRQRYWGEPIPLVWVSLDDYEKAKATDGVLKDLIPENAVTTDKGDQILYALPLPLANFLSNFPKLKIINPQEPVKVHLQLFQNGWIFGSIWRRGNPLPEPSQSPDGENWVSATRETNTMPQWAGSCWYHLRYIDPKNSVCIVDKEKETYWGGPDFYIGGAEHAVLHLLYARFWHRFLYDEGVLANPEPYKNFFIRDSFLARTETKCPRV